MIQLTREQHEQLYGKLGEKEYPKIVTDNEFLKLATRGLLQQTERQWRKCQYLVDELL